MSDSTISEIDSINYVIFSASYFGVSEVINTNSAVLILDKDSINVLKDLFINNDLIAICTCGYNYRIQFFDNKGNSIWCEMYYPLNEYSRSDDKIRSIVRDLSIRMYKKPTHYIYNIEVTQNMQSAMAVLRDNGFLPLSLEDISSNDKGSSFQIVSDEEFGSLKNKLKKYPFVKRVEKALNSLDINEDNSRYALTMSTSRDEGIAAFTETEQMPQFDGGEKEMYRFIDKNLKYPEAALEAKKEGRVVVRFIVTADGEVIHPEILRNLHPDCDKEVLRLIKSMPRWIPGKVNDIEVPVYFTIAVVFKLPK